MPASSRGLEMASETEVRVDGQLLNRLVHGFQVSLSDFHVGILQIAAVLQDNVLLCTQR